MKALVTGGAGFIGSHLVEALSAEGDEVVALDNLESRVHPDESLLPRNVNAEFIRGDVRNRADWKRALDGVDVVFHQAAYQDYMPDYSKFFSSNVVGTALMYEVIFERKLKVRKIVVASSQAVYGEGQYECVTHGGVLPHARSRAQMEQGDWEVRCPICGQEVHPQLLEEPHPNPFNPYALSKYSQELAALRLGRLVGVPTVALRYSITQGPRQSPYNAYSGICRIFTMRLLNGQPPVVYEDGRQLRDYVHVSDVVAANLLVLRDERANFEALNVGSGVATSVLEYAHLLAETLGVEIAPVVPSKFRVGDNRHSVSSIEKIKRLGWSPRRGLRDIMTDYVSWLKESGAKGQIDQQADLEMEQSGVVCRASDSRGGPV